MEGRFRIVAGTGDAVRRAVRFAAAALFPHRCAACGNEGKALCTRCADTGRASISGVFCCPGCESEALLGMRCDRDSCRDFPVDAVVSMAPYRTPFLRELLHQYKYAGVDEAKDVLADFFGFFLEAHTGALLPLFDGASLVPMPLHFFREAARGFNQAEVFAETAAKIFGSDVMRPLSRTMQFTAQASIDERTQRAMNAVGTVRLSADATAPIRAIIVDDVYTSGATIAECARVLKKNGCSFVAALTLLRG